MNIVSGTGINMVTDFTKITFDAKSHTYTYLGRHLMPVTSALKWVVPEFDTETAVASKMVETGKTRQEILAEWDHKRDTGLERGTRTHAYIEAVIEQNGVDVLSAVNDKSHEMLEFDKAWERMQSVLKAELFKKEWTIGDAQLGIAGRCDAIFDIVSGGKKKKILVDWKTGKYMLRKYAKEPMLPPFNEYPNCEEVKYSLQLSLYRLIIERNTDMKIDAAYILHLPSDHEYHMYNTIDFRSEAESWLLTANDNGTFGDPILEKKTEKLITTLDGYSLPKLLMLSPGCRQRLLAKMDRIYTDVNKIWKA